MTTETKTYGPYPYRAPVARDENPAAHGGVCYRDERADQVRLRNVNGDHEEVGPWRSR